MANNQKNQKTFFSPIAAVLFFIIFVPMNMQAQAPPAPGVWNGSSTQTTTGNALGVGTTTPEGWGEIKYCDPTQSGLIVTQSDCGGQLYINPPTMDGAAFNTVGTPGWTYSLDGDSFYTPPRPPTFTLTRPTGRPFAPLLWARTENQAPVRSYTSSLYSTRFIVTPDGLTGINVEKTRATLDVKCLGARSTNNPVAIFGQQVTDTRTRHVMFIPRCAAKGYNEIVQRDDYGIFFTNGLGDSSANHGGCLVIAPYAANANPNIGGLRIDSAGNLDVAGTLRTTQITVAAKWWSDFVFSPTYKLRPLSEVAAYIQTNKHLPDMPAAGQLKKEGINVADMQARQTQKIEELTLYLIQQQKQLKEQATQIQNLQEKIEAMQSK